MNWFLLSLLLLSVRVAATCFVVGMDVTADFLYLRPHLCDLEFALEDPRPYGDPITSQPTGVDLFLPNGSVLGSYPGRTAAFQVGVAYLFCGGCRELYFGYTGLWSRVRRSIKTTGEAGLWVIQGPPRHENLRLNGASIALNVSGAMTEAAVPAATASQQVHIEHNRVDAAWAWRQWASCHLWTRAYTGLRWADICCRQTADYTGVVTFVGLDQLQRSVRIVANQISHSYSKSEVWGIGPLIGGNLRYILCGNLGLTVHAAASLLVGQNSQHLHAFFMRGSLMPDVDPSNNVDEFLDLSIRPSTAFIPEIDARLGLSYGLLCGAQISWLLEVGWEFTTYLHSVARTRFDDIAGTNREICESFSLEGLYLSISVRI